jgi:hypothetical protein
MLRADELLAALTQAAGLPAVKMRFRDLTKGDSEECYAFFAEASRFDSLTQFCAASLRQLCAALEVELTDIGALEVRPVPREAWMIGMYDASLPGDAEAMYGPLPPRLKIRYTLDLKLGIVDDCNVCSSKSDYVLLYWQTSG